MRNLSLLDAIKRELESGTPLDIIFTKFNLSRSVLNELSSIKSRPYQTTIARLLQIRLSKNDTGNQQHLPSIPPPKQTSTSLVISVAGRTGDVVLDETDISGLITTLASKAPLSSPALIDTPTAPTAAPGTNTTQIATTAFVLANASTSNATYVAELSGINGSHISHGFFWPNGVPSPAELGVFLHECWIAFTSGGYWLSDGFGGGHPGGLDGVATIPGPFAGNLNDGTHANSFGGTYHVSLNEWVHRAYCMAGTVIYSFVNGICDGWVTYTQTGGLTRPTMNWDGGNGVLFIGGSNHQCAGCRIAAIRLFDRGYNPLASNPDKAFVPSRVFPSLVGNGTSVGDGFADFVAIYADRTFQDRSPRGVSHQSPGGTYDATLRTFHHGYPITAGENVNDRSGFSGLPIVGTLPTFVQDATCPFGRGYGDITLPNWIVPTPLTPPVGCLSFDSFSRRPQTLAFDAVPTLGSTEAGSLGPLVWQTGITTGSLATRPAPFGIFQTLGLGTAVNLESSPAVAWVPIGTANQDIRIKRDLSIYASGQTCLAFRVQDKDNYWFAAIDVSSPSADHNLYIVKVVAGTMTFVAGGSVASHIAKPYVRIVANGTTITAYMSIDGVTWTSALFTATSQTDLQTAQGAGIANLYFANAANGSLMRFKEWTAFAG
jgi:hypothetical protein